MSGWLTFWTWALLIGLSFFTLVVITVTIGGLRDIRDMLRSLKAGGNDPDFEAIASEADGTFEPILDEDDDGKAGRG